MGLAFEKPGFSEPCLSVPMLKHLFHWVCATRRQGLSCDPCLYIILVQEALLYTVFLSIMKSSEPLWLFPMVFLETWNVAVKVVLSFYVYVLSHFIVSFCIVVFPFSDLIF